MQRIFCVFLIAAQLTLAGDFVKQLTPKDVKPGLKLPLPTVELTAKITCAIPLKEIKVINPNRIDPIAAPYKSRNFDKGFAHPAPIPACPSR